MKLMLIDGNSIVNRAFFGIRMLNAPDGTPTNGIYGFLAILQRMLAQEQPDGLCVAFDVHAPTFRHKAYDAYKGTRKGMPEDLQVQMPLLKQVLDSLGIRRVELAGYEADDLLGTMSRAALRSGDEAVIVTGDRDALQLVTDGVRVLHVRTKGGQTETTDYTPEVFAAEYGFAPPYLVDLKALMGDASDNIPGVPGVGEKTAMDLMHTYGSLDAIYAALDSGADGFKAALRKKLDEGRESAKMSYMLAAIVTDAPIDFTPASAPWPGKVREDAYDLFVRLGFSKMIEKFGLHEAPAQQTAADAQSPDWPGALSVLSADSASAAADEMRGCAVFVMCGADGTLCFYPLRRLPDAIPGLEATHAAPAGSADAFLLPASALHAPGGADAAAALFAAPAAVCGHNLKDIQRMLLACGAADDLDQIRWCFDTALAVYLLDATASDYSAERLALRYGGFRMREQGAAADQQSLFDTAEESAAQQSLADEAAALASLLPRLASELRDENLQQLYYGTELPLCAVLAEMEHTGVGVDRAALHAFGESLTGSIDALQQSIWQMAGGEFNINSPKQLGTVLFEQLGLPGGKKTKTGWSTNADVLDRLRPIHPIVNEILDYRMLTKLKSTYADGLLKVIEPDGRIRTSFQMTVTATGRLSSTEPNLQNIPIRKELGAQIRGMFTAAPGNMLVDADYSQIELRLLAHISGDENMREAFRSGEDIHTVTASQVFGVPIPEVTRAERSRAKAVNFGIVYGISAWSLAQDINVSAAEAKAYMDAYLTRYSGVREYQKNSAEQARSKGYAETAFGRRRAVPELKSANFATRSFGERVAMNMPVQGTAADVIKMAMVRVRNALRASGLHARLILQVHDELVAECPEQEAEQVRALLKREMEQTVSLSVPLRADALCGHTWAEAH